MRTHTNPSAALVTDAQNSLSIRYDDEIYRPTSDLIQKVLCHRVCIREAEIETLALTEKVGIIGDCLSLSGSIHYRHELLQVSL